MRGINRSTSTRKSGAGLTKAAGWIATAFGAVHAIVAPLDTRDVWSDVLDDGWWNTFTLDRSITLAQFERSETFWVSLGSFGVPVLVLGCHVLWSVRQHHRVPAWIGWIILAWGLLVVTALPASPGWALPIVGGLIVLGDRRAGRVRQLHRWRSKSRSNLADSGAASLGQSLDDHVDVDSGGVRGDGERKAITA